MEVGDAVIIHPIAKLTDVSAIGQTGVFATELGEEEFNDGFGRARPRGLEECRYPAVDLLGEGNKFARGEHATFFFVVATLP